MSYIVKGDCLEKMKDIPDCSIDAIICDLPYETTKCEWDVIIPFEPLWEQYKRIIKPNSAIVLFGQEPFSSLLRMSNIEDYKYDWYWEKERLTNIFQVKNRPGKTIETISVFYKNQCTYNVQKDNYYGERRTNKIKKGKLGKLVDNSLKKPFEYNDDGTRYPTQLLRFKRDILTCNLHPTQKPEKLMDFLIKVYTHEGDTILDNAMGSGTTIVSAINNNRKYIGIEKVNSIFEVAEKRINKTLANKASDLTNILRS